MSRGRKNLMMEALDSSTEIEEGQKIMKVVSLRGSNIMEVMDCTGFQTLALLPAKFHKSIWIKKGSFVLVEEADREKALESGSKVTCTILRVLFEEHVRMLRRASLWPQEFEISKSSGNDETASEVICKSNKELLVLNSEDGNEEEYSSDDGLPPIEANNNRRPCNELISTSESELESDSSYDKLSQIVDVSDIF